MRFRKSASIIAFKVRNFVALEGLNIDENESYQYNLIQEIKLYSKQGEVCPHHRSLLVGHFPLKPLKSQFGE